MIVPRKLTHDDLWAFKDVGKVTLSPDGKTLAFVRINAEKERNEWCSSIWLLSLDEQGQASGEPRKLTSGIKSDSNPVWAPDSQRLLFLSSREEDKNQLWLIDTHGGEARKLTNMQHGVADAAWSPNGQWIAFTALAAPTDEDDVLSGSKPLSSEARKKYEEDARLHPRTITKIWYRLDGFGLYDYFPHVFVMPAPKDDESVDSASIRRLTRGEYGHSALQWTPDSQEICALCNRAEDRDRTWLEDLWAIDIETRAERCLTDGTQLINAYSWSPDGRQALLISQQDMRKGGWDLVHLSLIPREGGSQRLLLTDLDRDIAPTGGTGFGFPSPYAPLWSEDGQRAYVIVTDRASSNIHCLDMEQGSLTSLTNGDHAIFWQALLPGERGLLFAQQDSSHPWEFYHLPLAGNATAEPQRLTHLYDSAIAEFIWSRTERIEYKGANGDPIDGWIIYPVGAKAGVRYPMITVIHGGPQSNFVEGINPVLHYYAAQGFAVFYCNPHGSTGSGKAFTQQVEGDWGGWDYQDIMLGVDECIARGIADPERLVVTGYSYGGYMSSYIIGKTGRFKAAVPMAIVSNLASFVGTSDLGFWLTIQSKGYPWDPERAAYYSDRSPLTRAGNVTTPTRIVHPENDLRCPIEQSEQLYMALKMMGNVPVELVRIPSAWHGGASKPGNFYVLRKLAMEWFLKYVEVRPEEYN